MLNNIKKLLQNIVFEDDVEELITLRRDLENATSYIHAEIKEKSLPLFLVMGAQKCGKTSLLTMTHLTIRKSFPVNNTQQFDKQPISAENILEHDSDYDDQEQDHHHQFHITNNAVYLDLSGKYATSEIKKNDTLWHKALTILWQHRATLPIAGLVLVIDISQLLNQNKQQRNVHLHLLKQRIFEINKLIKEPIPVYIVLSKADLLAGFKECFSHVSSTEREKSFGIDFRNYLSLGSPDQTLSSWFYNQFDTLLEKTNQHLITFLHHEHNLHKRQLIFEYVIQLENIKDHLKQIVLVLAEKTMYCNASIPLGMYFTSALQQGMPVDRLIQSYDKLLKGSKKQVKKFYSIKQQSFFVKDLFSTQISSSINKTFTKPIVNRWKIWLSFGAVTTTFISALFYILYQFNSDIDKLMSAQMSLIHSYFSKEHANQAEANQHVKTANNLVEEAAIFWLIKSNHHYHVKKEAVVKIQKPKQNKIVNNTSVELTKSLETSLANENNPPDMVYNTLKAYLMLENPDKFNNDFFLALNKKILLDKGTDPQEFQQH